MSGFILLENILKIFLDDNQCIFIYEDDSWTIKGLYEDAVANDEDAVWSYENNQDIMRLLIASISFYDAWFLYIQFVQ